MTGWRDQTMLALQRANTAKTVSLNHVFHDFRIPVDAIILNKNRRYEKFMRSVFLCARVPKGKMSAKLTAPGARLSIRAVNEPGQGDVLTNYECINVYNEQVHEKWR